MNKTLKSIIGLTVCFSLLNLPVIACGTENRDESTGQTNGISEAGLKYMQSEEYKENIRRKKEAMAKPDFAENSRKERERVLALNAQKEADILAKEKEDSEEKIAGFFNGISEEGLRYMQSDEYKENIRLKKENAKAMGLTTQRATKKLSINHYTQAGKYDCGPASAQIVIKYHTGIKYSLSDLGDQMGTGIMELMLIV